MKRPVSFYSEGFRLDDDHLIPPPAFSEVMRATVAWYPEHLPARG